MKPDPLEDERPEDQERTPATPESRKKEPAPATPPADARKPLDLRVHTVRREHDAAGSH